MATAGRRAQPESGLVDGARSRAAPAGVAPGGTERAADHGVRVLYQRHYAALVGVAALLVGDVATRTSAA
jgi:hypothetical protein